MSVLFSVQKTAYTLQIPAQKKIHKWYQCWGVNRAHREQFFFCTRAEKLMSAHGVNEAFKVAASFEYFLK